MVKLTKAEKKLLKWQWSDARAILFNDLVNNKVPLYWKRGDMTAAQAFDQLYKDEPPFQISDFGDITKFKTRLSSLRKIVKQKSERAEEDALALAHDQLIFPEPILDIRGYPNWRKSEARKQLKKDLTEGKHKNRRPMVLWLSHPEYQKFPLTVFRNHIYKELRKMKKGGRKKHGVRSK